MGRANQEGFRVGAVLVAYNISQERLQAALAAVMPQVLRLLLVDNSDAGVPVPRELLPENLDCLRFPDNPGPGAAHNQGISWARAQGFSHLLILDQDSEPAPDMVAELLRPFAEETADGRLAMTGPAWQNRNSSRSPCFQRLRSPFGKRIYVHKLPARALVEADLLISSGSLLSLAAAEALGPMREEFFIDRIDTDWCLRAKSRGYRLVGVPAAKLAHQLGEESAHIWLGIWRRLPLHRPERYYYMFRNSILLYQTRYASWAWTLFDFCRLAGILLLLCPCVKKDRGARLKYIWQGILHGCQGRTGRMPGRRHLSLPDS